MKQFRFFFSFLAFVAMGSLFATAPVSAAAPEKGRFHLIYLVSAVDLKPGSKVTVDPIFFTDGKEVKNFHDFCRKQNPLKPEEVAPDQKFIEDYCARKTFTLKAMGYHTLNNHGQRLGLDAIEFKVIDHIAQTKEAVMMGSSTAASYAPGTINPPKWLRNDGAPEYFFLMAKDKTILEKIVPVPKASQAEVAKLTKRAEEFSGVARGKVTGVPLKINDISKARDCVHSKSLILSRIENPLLADLDLDGKLDMLVSAYAIVRVEEESDKPLVDCFTRYEILGNGDAYLVGNQNLVRTSWASRRHPGGVYERYLKNGYAQNAPLMVVNLPGKNRACAYIVEYVAHSHLQHTYGVISSRDRSCLPIGLHSKFKSVFLETPERGEAQ